MSEQRTSRLAHRLAIATAVSAVFLLLFGGTVTGIEAGMAVDGWWIVDRGKGDHFLLFYPVSDWLHSTGKFYEHVHRLIGALVGLFAIATLVLAWLRDGRRGAVIASGVALLAIMLQGALGGFRVLENSPQLAFLHGSFGQLTFGVIIAAATVLSPAWAGAERRPCKLAGRLHRRSLLTAMVVFATIVAGAFLRHGMRHGKHAAGESAMASIMPLLLHLSLVTVAIVLVVALVRGLRQTAAEGEAGDHDRSALRSLARRLVWIGTAQVLLGIGSFLVVFVFSGPQVAYVHQSLVPTLHVLFGALLFSQCLCAALWSRRLVSSGATSPSLAPRAAHLGGAL